MPRAKITVGVVRNPTKLAKVLNDQQLQISSIRVMCDAMVRRLEPKKAKAKEKAAAKAKAKEKKARKDAKDS